jgi:hypothetical protein
MGGAMYQRWAASPQGGDGSESRGGGTRYPLECECIARTHGCTPCTLSHCSHVEGWVVVGQSVTHIPYP